jgi:hypothetical protein
MIPTGGTYAWHTTSAGNCIEVDAIDCCRILSRRETPIGVLRHPPAARQRNHL